MRYARLVVPVRHDQPAEGRNQARILSTFGYFWRDKGRMGEQYAKRTTSPR